MSSKGVSSGVGGWGKASSRGMEERRGSPEGSTGNGAWGEGGHRWLSAVELGMRMGH